MDRHLGGSPGGEAVGVSASGRIRLEIQGTVQGVGFRPFVHRLAGKHALGGFVNNGGRGVLIELEGPPEALEGFLADFKDTLPPLARVERLVRSDIQPRGERGFRIEASDQDGDRFTLISPDIATCPACLEELEDPADRRFGYAFINCTDCGPRFTIIRDIPYDREKTTMAGFVLCPACLEEYRDPERRRFHAEPVACPACGPRLSLLDSRGRPVEGDPLEAAAGLLAQGQVLAIKGLGGFHLACDPFSETAVGSLRSRKHREDKPFAIMARDLDAARELCAISPDEEDLLLAPERPIVLLRRRESSAGGAAARLAHGVAPGFRELGVFLPYTPLHHLLLKYAGPALVMTSGNISDEPIAYRDGEARERLGGIADYLLGHDREIETRCDDSVLAHREGAPRFLRRSRGYAPRPLVLARPLARQVLACGAELKNTFCLGRDNFAFLSHHIGDLENEATLRSFEEGVRHFQRMFRVQPEVVVHDLHPDYLSTRYALELSGGPEILGVQHHHAHVVSAMAEHGLEGRVIGVAFDGTGYGTDGHLWGSEFLVCGLRDFRRAAHFSYFPLPGGEQAIRQPWRIAWALLLEAFGAGAWDRVALLPAGPQGGRAGEAQGGRAGEAQGGESRAVLETLERMIEKGVNSPLSCGMGRLFDAASALLTGRAGINYEGQAAIELEQLADGDCGGDSGGEFPLDSVAPLDSAALLAQVAGGLESGEPPARLAAMFHHTIAAATARTCAAISAETGLDRVVLTGGVFQNRLLLRGTLRRLEQLGLKWYIHQQVPANDGGISLGQAIIGGTVECA